MGLENDKWGAVMGYKEKIDNHFGLSVMSLIVATILTSLSVLQLLEFKIVREGSYVLKEDLVGKYIPIDEAKTKYVPQWEGEIKTREDRIKELTEKLRMIEAQYSEATRKEASSGNQLSVCEEQKQQVKSDATKIKQNIDQLESEQQQARTALIANDVRLKRRAELLQKASGWVNQDLMLEIKDELKNK